MTYKRRLEELELFSLMKRRLLGVFYKSSGTWRVVIKKRMILFSLSKGSKTKSINLNWQQELNLGCVIQSPIFL